MSRLLQLTAVVCCAVALAGCPPRNDDPAPVNRFEVAQNVCDFHRTVPNSITAVQTINNSVIYGSNVNAASVALPTIWASIFATQRDALTQTHAQVGFCCSWNNGLYFCGQQYCQSEERRNVSALFGVGRAQTQEDAESLAQDNCKQIVDQYKRANSIGYSSALRCTKLVTQQCF